MRFHHDLSLIAPALLQGRLRAPGQPGRHWHIGLFVNDRFHGAVAADLPLADPRAETGEGFAITLNLAALQDADLIRLEVLGTEHVLTETTLAELRGGRAAPVSGAGSVWSVRGLTLAGRLEDGMTRLPSYEILAFEEDRLVGRSRIWRWQHVGEPQDPMGRAIAFDLFLDPALADGQVHAIHVETSTGQVLDGSPVEVIAWPNALMTQLDRKQVPGTEAHQRRLDRALEGLLGNSMGLEGYGALYPELAETADWPGSFEIAADGIAHPIPESGWVLLTHRDIRPLPAFAERLRAALPRMPQARAVFCDLVLRESDGTLWPLLMPAFDWERLLEQGHAALCMALPEAALQTPAASLVGQLLQWLAPEGQGPDRRQIWHLPHPGGIAEAAALRASCATRSAALAAALQRPGLLPPGTRLHDAPRPGALFPALHLNRPPRQRAVSVIVPSRNNAALLEAAIAGLKTQNPGFDLDLMIVDHASDTPEALALFDRLESDGARILRVAGGFNFARMNNLAAAQARHAQLCFMNNDVDFPVPGVLAELSGRLTEDSTGAVGPLMMRASEIIQHGGVTLGPWVGAVHAFEDRMRGDPGYAEMLRCAHEPGGLTAAMLLTRRDLFERLGGFDAERFAVNFNDVDYGLKLRAAGYRLVLSPHVVIRHHESLSRGRERGTPAGLRMQRELASLRAKWREALLNDTQFHPLFALDGLPYRGLSLVHRDPAPRCAGYPIARPLPDGF